MNPRKFTDEQLQEARRLRDSGEKWAVVEAILGAGIRNAVAWASSTRREKYRCTHCAATVHRNRFACAACGTLTATAKAARA